MPNQIITVFFTSGSGSPAVGLTPEIRVIDLSTKNIVTSSNMDDCGLGIYSFTFTQYNFSSSYAFRADGLSNDLDARYQFAGNESYIDDIWGAPRENYITPGSTGQALRDIFDIEVGSWRITANGEMELLRSGSNQIIAKFDLRKLDGSSLTDPTTEDPFRRDRI